MGKQEFPICCGQDLCKAKRTAKKLDGMIVLSAPEGGKWDDPVNTFVYWVDGKCSMIRYWEMIVEND